MQILSEVFEVFYTSRRSERRKF